MPASAPAVIQGHSSSLLLLDSRIYLRSSHSALAPSTGGQSLENSRNSFISMAICVYLHLAHYVVTHACRYGMITSLVSDVQMLPRLLVNWLNLLPWRTLLQLRPCPPAVQMWPWLWVREMPAISYGVQDWAAIAMASVRWVFLSRRGGDGSRWRWYPSNDQTVMAYAANTWTTC